MDAALLIARLIIGLALAAHGIQKLFGWFSGYALKGTVGFYESIGFRPGLLFGVTAGLGEVGGGLLTATGLLGPIGPSLIITVMVAGIVTVHLPNGFFARANRYELPRVYAVLGFVLAILGPGMYSVGCAPRSVGSVERERGLVPSYSISTLLTRNLHDVFGENDPARRRAVIDEIYTEDCVFYDPHRGVYRGRDAIDRIAGTIRAPHPDFRYQPIAGPEELGNGGQVQWVSGRPGETPDHAGTDFIIARDGRIAALYVFFDKLP